MENKNSKYKFDFNLLKTSLSKDLDIAKKEWNIVCKEKRKENDGHCICQRKVKNVIYMYNIKTKNTIVVGNTCFKKFKMENNVIGNKILSNILEYKLKRGEYENINNIIVYSTSVKEQLLQYLDSEFNILIDNYVQYCIKFKKDFDCEDNLGNLTKFCNSINNLIQEYKIEYLDDIYSQVINEIKNKIIIKVKYNKIKDYEESKKYYVRKYVYDYLPGHGKDIIGYRSEKYSSLEECEIYISSNPKIGYVKRCYYNAEEIILKFEILNDDQIIKTVTSEEENERLEYMLSHGGYSVKWRKV